MAFGLMGLVVSFSIDGLDGVFPLMAFLHSQNPNGRLDGRCRTEKYSNE